MPSVAGEHGGPDRDLDDPDRFVWILRYRGPKTWEDADGGYYASPERVAMQPDPARHIVKAEHWPMHEQTFG